MLADESWRLGAHGVRIVHVYLRGLKDPGRPLTFLVQAVSVGVGVSADSGSLLRSRIKEIKNNFPYGDEGYRVLKCAV